MAKSIKTQGVYWFTVFQLTVYGGKPEMENAKEIITLNTLYGQIG